MEAGVREAIAATLAQERNHVILARVGAITRYARDFPVRLGVIKTHSWCAE